MILHCLFSCHRDTEDTENGLSEENSLCPPCLCGRYKMVILSMYLSGQEPYT